jgi:hypothetical protein
LSIDGVNTTFQSGLSLPYWLKAGQTLNVIANANSVSIMEFTVDSSTLKYSRVISLNSLQTVPSGKIWKIEAIGIATIGGTLGFSTTSIPTILTSPKTFSTPGTYSWTVPPNVTSICVEVWGGGGSGDIVAYNMYGTRGGGGGGGGYGYQCFLVVPGTTYAVTVGGGGVYSSSGGNNGETSSLGALISATGGSKGSNYNTSAPFWGPVGSGGVSTATFNISGSDATSPYSTNTNYIGADGANGGQGGNNLLGISAAAPGGGGSGGQSGQGGGAGSGAPGRVIIHW